MSNDPTLCLLSTPGRGGGLPASTFTQKQKGACQGGALHNSEPVTYQPTLLQFGNALNAIVLVESEIVPAIRRVLDEGEQFLRAADVAEKGNQGSALPIERRNALRSWIAGQLQQLGTVKSCLSADGYIEIALVKFLFCGGICQNGCPFVNPGSVNSCPSAEIMPWESTSRSILRVVIRPFFESIMLEPKVCSPPRPIAAR
jgi:hypothetical protein